MRQKSMKNYPVGRELLIFLFEQVMAGTGNLEVLRMCRMFRSRVGPPYSLYVMYGSHMAVSMALGLLFLGGGK